MNNSRDILLSVVVPSRNRPTYLSHLLEFLLKSTRINFELIIEDNSDQSHRFDVSSKFLSDKRVKYTYNSTRISIDLNCDNAIKRASGVFVCMIGDDDGVLLDEALDFLDYISLTDIDSILVQPMYYAWPSVSHRTWGNVGGTLFLQPSTKVVKDIDIDLARKKLLNHGGAYGIEDLPRLYHGFIRRTILEQLFDEVHTYFPGPSPDMASSFALSMFVTRCVMYDYPLVIAGHSKGSAGGMGSAKTHVGEIANQPHLPSYTDRTWCPSIPHFWSGPTIYAQSVFHVIQSVSRCKGFKINYSHLYAVCFVYESFFWRRTLSSMWSNTQLKILLFSVTTIDIVFIFIRRLISFIKNVFKYKLDVKRKIFSVTLESAVVVFRARV
jgi:glycosyltransferase involved in cell wall biosynthesis